MPPMLIAMRLADMHTVHPRQDNSRVCSRCNEPVGLYPSGQAAARRYPDLVIMCHVCQQPGPTARPAPGALQEIGEGVPASNGQAS